MRVSTDSIHNIVKICLFLIINTDIASNPLHSKITWSVTIYSLRPATWKSVKSQVTLRYRLSCDKDAYFN